MNLPSFLKICFIINDFMLLWTKTVLSDKLNISLPLSQSTGRTQLDVLRAVIVQIFLMLLWPVSRVFKSETKIR